MAITMFRPEQQQQAPQAPTQIGTREDEARRRLLAGLQGGPKPAEDDRWGNAQHAINTGINYWAGLDDMKQAKAADQAQAAQQQANQQNLAGLLVGGSKGGYR